ncbi:MAG: hypothetical protein JST33_04550 [Actinobacteria bacterium]|nr:hypothetical protein [Actinomycetota bacterium]
MRELSHRESLLAVLGTRFDDPGFHCLDEPEAALSFSSTRSLIAVLRRIADQGGAGVLRDAFALLAALPCARILEVGEWGLRPAIREDLELVRRRRSFLGEPARYTRHLLD